MSAQWAIKLRRGKHSQAAETTQVRSPAAMPPQPAQQTFALVHRPLASQCMARCCLVGHMRQCSHLRQGAPLSLLRPMWTTLAHKVQVLSPLRRVGFGFAPRDGLTHFNTLTRPPIAQLLSRRQDTQRPFREGRLHAQAFGQPANIDQARCATPSTPDQGSGGGTRRFAGLGAKRQGGQVR